MLEHGGRLRAAARQYSIPLADWLDLSAAINPSTYPVGDIPAHVWQRLPEDDDGLQQIAAHYYGKDQLLPVAGSQVAIQLLPLLMPPLLRVGMLHPSYNEHAYAWQQAGHQLMLLSAATIEQNLHTLDVLLLVNPNNPTGEIFLPEQLLHWRAQLAQRNGLLIVDEAFIDATPDNSLAPYTGMEGLVVLRSLGKFFGLAGARVGFVLAPQCLRDALCEMIGPWSISHPSREAAIRAQA
jgi:cobalamin biosynthetic protein CobC